MDIIEDISCGVWCFVPDEVFRVLFVAAAVCVGCVSRSFFTVLWVWCEYRKEKRERERRTGGYLRAQMVAENNSEGLREEQRTNVIVLDWEMEAMGQTHCYVNDSEVDNKEFSH